MSQSIPPEKRDLLIAGYILNDLDAEEATLMAELLNDADVAQSIQRMQQIVEAVYSDTPVSPPTHLRDVIVKLAQAKTSQTEDRPQSPPMIDSAATPVKLPRWAKVLGAVAAVVIVGLSLTNYLLWRSLRELQIQQAQIEQNTLIFALEPTDNLVNEAKVLVKVNPTTLRGTLVVENLPPLEPGKVYVLWTVLTPDAPFTTDDKNAILTEVFTPSTLENQSQSLILPPAFQNLQLIKAVAVTIEDATTPQDHQSAPILIRRR